MVAGIAHFCGGLQASRLFWRSKYVRNNRYFELEHVSNTYTADDDGNVTNHTNWRGTAENYGSIFGTLTFGPSRLVTWMKNLKAVKSAGPDRGSWKMVPLSGVGKGTWRKDPQGHVWHTDVTTELNDGSKVRQRVLELATLKFTELTTLLEIGD